MLDYYKYQDDVIKIKTEFLALATSHFNDPKQLQLIKKALDYAERAHYGQNRKSGQPYIIHPIITAKYLMEWKMDYETVIGGLLHDLIEDTNITYQQLVLEFDYTIADIVQTVSKVTKYSKKKRDDINEKKLNNMYVVQVFLSMSKDLRAIAVKLADRTHNIETINFLTPTKQVSIAKETLEIYATIAGRLGMYNVKTRLEDLSFKIIDPTSYNSIKKQVSKLEDKIFDTWNRIKNQIKNLLDVENIPYEIQARIKGIYSIWKKMEKGYLPENIHDIFAMRIIVEKDLECYKVLGLIHLNFIYIINAFKDFISLPKWNLYRCIHTTVVVNHFLIEFQIRTKEMHEISQMGLAAHWKYKEKDKYLHVSQKLIDEFLQGRDASVEIIKGISQNQLFDILVQNDNQFYVSSNHTTLLDLAYRYDNNKLKYLVTTFKNGEMVDFDTRIQKGDVVQFHYGKHVTMNESWTQMTQNLSLINHIKWVCQERTRKKLSNLHNFLKECQTYLQVDAIDENNYKKRFNYLNYKNLEDYIDGMKKIAIERETVFDFLSLDEKTWKEAYKILKKKLAIKVYWDTYYEPLEGIAPDKIITSDCCSKYPNNHLVGILKNNVLKVHRHDCNKASMHRGKRVVVNWNMKELAKKPCLFNVKLKIFGNLTPTIANQIAQMLLQHKVIIEKIDIQKHLDHIKFKGDLMLRINNDNQLKKLLEDLIHKKYINNYEII